MDEFKKGSVRIAVIGGSGAYHLLTKESLGKEKKCQSFDTPYGESAPIHHFSIDGLEFLFLSRHGEMDYSITAPFVNYRANILRLKRMWCTEDYCLVGPWYHQYSFRAWRFCSAARYN